ncbi:MAG TPA: type II toxin-antitoxin system HicA family toxin [Flavobacteriaceae bacterium]|nr:type II toxin-antitoxin system HicA family toxin [Flavobacteriaceae bacterium]
MKSSELLRLMKKDGWYKVRQKGSHIIMKHPTKPNIISVPFHASKEMKKGTLSNILKIAKIKTKKR